MVHSHPMAYAEVYVPDYWALLTEPWVMPHVNGGGTQMTRVKRQPDAEATVEENAARVVDNAADLYLDRVRKFETTLRSNAHHSD